MAPSSSVDAIAAPERLPISRRVADLPWRDWLADARHFQIASLAVLLGLNMAWLDFGARPLPSLLAIASTLGAQIACSQLWRLPRIDLRSPLITGFSLSLLLRTDDPALMAVAGIIAIVAKFTIRIDGKHLFNPAAIAIVTLLYSTDRVWISPGQWGASVWFAALLAFLAILVLHASRRTDIALFFLGSHAALLLARALWLGDPLAIPLHQLENGALLLFAFFMISDPRTAPDARLGRLVFALAVALLAHWLAFFQQLRPALPVALVAVSLLTPFLDRLLPAERFQWSQTAQKGVLR
jgi:Na+-transporting NADH:ubiquinone oxidoreductase subunit NqrB